MVSFPKSAQGLLTYAGMSFIRSGLCRPKLRNMAGLLLSFLLYFAPGAHAQEPAANDLKKNDTAAITKKDRKLVKRLIADHSKIVSSSSRILDLDRSANNKELARIIMNDNVQLLNRFKAFASHHNVKYKDPQEYAPLLKDPITLASWRKKLIAYHRKEISHLRKRVDHIQNAWLKQIIKETLPFEQMHLMLIKNDYR